MPAVRRTISAFFPPQPAQRGSNGSGTAAAGPAAFCDNGSSRAAAAGRAAGAALAAIAKPPLDADAAARVATLLGKTPAAAPSELAAARSVSVNDGGARKRRKAVSDSGKPADSGGENGEGDSEPAAQAAGRKRKTRGLGKDTRPGKACGVSAETRLREFNVDGKSIREHGMEKDRTTGELWCRACRKPVTTKADRITDHIRSVSHQAAFEAVKKKDVRLQFVDTSLAAAVANNQVATGAHADNGGVTQKEVRFRLDTLRGWRYSGCELEKLDSFRPTKEEYAHLKLTNASHKGELIPVLRNAEVLELRAWLAGKHVQLALDGASREGECFGLTARIINTLTFKPETRLIALRRHSSSFCGKQLAGVLNTITHEFRIAPLDVIATSRDRAAYGRVAIEALKPFWSNSVDMECLPHTFSHVGQHMTHASLTEFHQGLSYMWCMSNKAQKLWEERMGHKPPRESANRWWSWWQVMRYVMERWGEIDGYLRDLRTNEFCKESVLKIDRLLNGWVEEKRSNASGNPPGQPSRHQHPSMRHSIMLELAASSTGASRSLR